MCGARAGPWRICLDCGPERELTSRTMGFCVFLWLLLLLFLPLSVSHSIPFFFNPPPTQSFTFSFNASISYLCIPPHSMLSDLSFFPSFFLSLRPSYSLLVYLFSRLRIPGRGIVTHNHKIIFGVCLFAFPLHLFGLCLQTIMLPQPRLRC